MKHSLPLCVLVLWAFCALFADSGRRFGIEILKADVDGEVVWRLLKTTKPVFSSCLEHGSVSNGQILVNCVQSEEMRSRNGLSYPVVATTCGQVKMTVSGVDLGE